MSFLLLRRFDATYKVDALASIASAANRAMDSVGDLLAFFKMKISYLMFKLEDLDDYMGSFLSKLPHGSLVALASNSNSTMGKVHNLADVSLDFPPFDV
jgi:hypothetical protein